MSAEDMATSTRQSMADAFNSNMFNAFDLKIKTKGKTLIKNMESQLKAADIYLSNISALSERGLSEGLMNKIISMGYTQGYEYTQALMQLSQNELLYLDDMFDEMNFMSSISENIYSDALQNAAYTDYLRDTGELMISSITEGIDATKPELVTNISQTVTQSVEEALAILETNSNEMQDKVNKYITKIFDGTISESTLDGEQIVNGISKGVTNQTPEVQNKIKYLASLMLAELANALGIASPSKEAAKLGDFFMQGLLKPISSTSIVVDSMKDLSDNLLYGVSESLDNINKALSDEYEESLVLTPVLDLSQVQNGAGRINSAFSSSQVALAAEDINIKNDTTRASEAKMIMEMIKKSAEDIVAGFQNTEFNVHSEIGLNPRSSALFDMVRTENDRVRASTGINYLAP